MPVLLITGNRPGAGKTSLAAALLVQLHRSGRPGAYWKPYSGSPDSDADVQFVSGVLSETLGLPPVPLPSPLQSPVAADELRGHLSGLQGSAEVVLTEVADSSQAAELADALDAGVLLVHDYDTADPLGAVRASAQASGGRLAGVILNAVPIYRRDAIAAEMAAQNLPSATVIPESRIMLSVTVEQIAGLLGGEWVLDPVNVDAPVERYLIGGNIMDSGPNYYGRHANQAVITRVQRPDIQLASMSTETRCLVLTGPGEPTEYIKAEARERDIPLIRVQSSTIDTAEALAGVLGQGTAHSLAKAEHFAELLTRYAAPGVLQGWLS